MYKAKFTLEAVTPIFMRGADQIKAEIRAPSIKGLMRWWFRALAGSYFGDDVVGLKKAEEFVFGSTKQKSKVTLDLADIHYGNSKISLVTVTTTFNKREKAYKLRAVTNIPKYLFFSLNMSLSLENLAQESLDMTLKKYGIRNSFRDKESIKRLLTRRGLSLEELKNKANEIFQEKIREFYYPAGSTFRLILKSSDADAFFFAVTSLWLFSLFGGLGSRARRGAGSVQVKLLTPTNLPDKYRNTITKMFNKCFTPIEINKEILSSIFNEVKNVLSKIHEIKVSPGYSKDELRRYPVLRNAYFLIPNTDKLKFNSPYDALNELEKIYAGKLSGKRYSGGFRFSFADYSLSHSINNLKIQTNKYWREYRYYFGLPLIYQHVGKKRKLSVSAIVSSDSKEKEYDRRASPLILTVKRDRSGLYYPVILVLVSEFVPNHDREFKIGNIKIKVERRFEEVFSHSEFLEKAKIEKTKLTELFSVFELKEVFP